MWNRLDWPQLATWMHRLHLAAILGQLIIVAWIPLGLVALVMAGPIVGSAALFTGLLTLQYPLFRLVVGPRGVNRSVETGDVLHRG